MPKLIPIQVVFASGHMVLVECTHWMQCGIPPLPEMEISGPKCTRTSGSRYNWWLWVQSVRLCQHRDSSVWTRDQTHTQWMTMTIVTKDDVNDGHLAFLLVGLPVFDSLSCDLLPS